MLAAGGDDIGEVEPGVRAQHDLPGSTGLS